MPVSAALTAAREAAAVSSPRPSAPARKTARSFTMMSLSPNPSDCWLHSAFASEALLVFLGVVQNVVSFQPFRAALGKGFESPLRLFRGELLVALERRRLGGRQLGERDIAEPRLGLGAQQMDPRHAGLGTLDHFQHV